jgi:hypothetical protein
MEHAIDAAVPTASSHERCMAWDAASSMSKPQKANTPKIKVVADAESDGGNQAYCQYEPRSEIRVLAQKCGGARMESRVMRRLERICGWTISIKFASISGAGGAASCAGAV